MFGWFGRKGAPEMMACGYSPPPWLRAAEGEGDFVRGYEGQLHEVYRSNPVGLRAVRLVAGAVGGLVVEAESEDAERLVQGRGLLEGITAALLLHGNAFVQLIADSHGTPRELALLRPERVSIATDERGHAAAYVYRAGGRAVRIAARDALHRRQVGHVKGLCSGQIPAVETAPRPPGQRMGDAWSRRRQGLCPAQCLDPEDDRAPGRKPWFSGDRHGPRAGRSGEPDAGDPSRERRGDAAIVARPSQGVVHARRDIVRQLAAAQPAGLVVARRSRGIHRPFGPGLSPAVHRVSRHH